MPKDLDAMLQMFVRADVAFIVSYQDPTCNTVTVKRDGVDVVFTFTKEGGALRRLTVL